MSRVTIDGVFVSISHEDYCKLGEEAVRLSTEKKPVTIDELAAKRFGKAKLAKPKKKES